MKNDSKLPPYHPSSTESVQDIPTRFLVGELLSLTAEGDWLYKGERVEHSGVQRFLSAQLQRTAEGEYWVVNGPQRVFVELDGAPFQIVHLTEQGGRFLALLNDGTEENLPLSKLWIDEEGTLFARVKHGKAGDDQGDGHHARLSRQAVYALAPYLEEGDQFYLKLPDREVQIAPMESLSLH